MGKSIRKIVNWKQYNQALASHGSLTFWVDEAAVKAWYCHEHHGGRGRELSYSYGECLTNEKVVWHWFEIYRSELTYPQLKLFLFKITGGVSADGNQSFDMLFSILIMF